MTNSEASYLIQLPSAEDLSCETRAGVEHRMRRRELAQPSVIVRDGNSDAELGPAS